MIIRLHPSGKSFKGLAQYLVHDPEKAQTTERVAWTHTLNCAHDHVPSAVHEMYTTMQVADALKRDAGVRSGQQVEKSVKHFSLSWDPTDRPSQDHMIATVESFLKHMTWQEHQAVLVAHDDKQHLHVHVMLNVIHPQSGKRFNDSHEWRRAERWGLAYELERGMVLCGQRLLDPADRTQSPTREASQKLKAYAREDDQADYERMNLDYFERHDTSTRNDREWRALKLHQREQREDYFAGGRQAYREARMGAYREVRETMRGEWHKYYQARAAGHDKMQLAATKAALVNRQNEMLDERRQVASTLLRYYRDREYAGLLQQQKAQRRDLGERQRQGLQTYRLSDQTALIDKGNAKEHSQRAQVRSRTHGDAAPVTIRTQFRAATFALRNAAQIVGEASREQDAKQKRWRQKPVPVLRPRGSDDQSRERQAAALRCATDSGRKLRDYENGVRRAWVRARPARDRGRD